MPVEEPALPELVELLRLEQRERWQTGDRVLVEAYFTLHPKLRVDQASALHLIYNEVLLREAVGERPALDDYVRRFPELAGQLPPLFEVHRALESDEFLGIVGHQPEPLDATRSYPPVTEGPGAIVGPYKLVQQIGEGGMGTVYVAEQTEPVRRVVALKIIKLGMDSRQVIARFEAERQALALMDHPNIAKVLDAGATDSGRPYFVMELVRGEPITKYCDEHRLALKDRLALFIPVCQAIQHAHQKGIIHRDIKPSNVLVALYDGRPVPKVIDFGVAKATGQQLTEHTLVTGFGSVVGTLEYMSPEQAELNQIDVDTRSDIYSLGVLLYELLTGTTPLERRRLKQAALLEVLRLIREEEPPKPSTRLSTAEGLPSIAANRSLEPKKLSGLVRGELDWIVMKALEKDRDRRYQTANAMARDMERYLGDEPVEACPPSAGYRLRKLVRRNRGPVLAGGVVLCCLVAGIAGTSWGLLRATREAHAARQARDRTLQALDAMTSGVTGDSLSSQVHISADQKKFLSQVLSYYQELAGETATDETARARTAAAAHRVGTIQVRLGRLPEAAAAFQSACDAYGTLSTDFPAVTTYQLELARSHSNRGVPLITLGQYAEAENDLRDAIAIAQSFTAAHPGTPECESVLGNAHHNRARLLSHQGKKSEAAEEYRAAVTIKEKLLTDSSAGPGYRRDLAASYTNLGITLQDLGKASEAEGHHRAASTIYERLAAEFPIVAQYRHESAAEHTNLGLAVQRQSKPLEAEQEYRKALAMLGPVTTDFPAVPEYQRDLAMTHLDLGLLLASQGRSSAAEEEYRKSIAVREKLVADFPGVSEYRWHLSTAHASLAFLLAGMGRTSEAITGYRRQIELEPRDARAHRDLAPLLARMQKTSEAAAEYRQVLEIEPTDSLARNNLAWLLATCPNPRLRDATQAIVQAKKALELAPEHGNYWNTLGIAHFRAGDCKSAIAALEKSNELLKGNELSFNAFFLAMAYWQSGSKDKGRTWYDQAVKWMEKNQPKDEELRRFRAEAEAMLGIGPSPTGRKQ
jgi:serine/threonine protein kinase/Flp pilus assembly protein TadD